MEAVDYSVDNGILTIRLQGHIDSVNAAEVERTIGDLRDKFDGFPVCG